MYSQNAAFQRAGIKPERGLPIMEDELFDRGWHGTSILCTFWPVHGVNEAGKEGRFGSVEDSRRRHGRVRGRLDSTGREEGRVACRGGQEASLNTWRKPIWQLHVCHGRLRTRQPVPQATPTSLRSDTSGLVAAFRPAGPR